MLRRDWDPIGISGRPGAEHQYDGYADKAYVMLMDGQPAAAIAAYLVDVATNHIGLGHQAWIVEASGNIAERLSELRPIFQARLEAPS